MKKTKKHSFSSITSITTSITTFPFSISIPICYHLSLHILLISSLSQLSIFLFIILHDLISFIFIINMTDSKKAEKHQISFLLNRPNQLQDNGRMDSSMTRGSNPGPSSSSQVANTNNHRSLSPASTRRRRCDECQKVFAQPADLKKQYVIILFSFLFIGLSKIINRKISKTNLIILYIFFSVKCVHRKERPFRCEHCPQAFGEKGNLK